MIKMKQRTLGVICATSLLLPAFFLRGAEENSLSFDLLRSKRPTAAGTRIVAAWADKAAAAKDGEGLLAAYLAAESADYGHEIWMRLRPLLHNDENQVLLRNMYGHIFFIRRNTFLPEHLLARIIPEKELNLYRQDADQYNAWLMWLAVNQNISGLWLDASKDAQCKDKDILCAAWALFSFLGCGHTEKVGIHYVNVRQTVKALISRQQEDGAIIAPDQEPTFVHAVAGLALSESAGMTWMQLNTVAAAQKAMDFSIKQFFRAGDGKTVKGSINDDEMPLSEKIWFLMQWRSAGGRSGVKADPACAEALKKMLDRLEGQGPDAGRFREKPGEPFTARATAMGLAGRIMLGAKKTDLHDSVRRLLKEGGTPEWDEAGAKVDLLYWYFGTFCAVNQGGDLWKEWNESMKKSLLDHQRKGTPDIDGSWDPVGRGAENWGRVGQTALAVMCIEIYYRYLPLYRLAAEEK